MKLPILVLDTQTLVRFALGLYLKLSHKAFFSLVDAKARIVIPSYSLEEILKKFPYQKRKSDDIPIPPTALLRALRSCSNARILPRGAAVLYREFELNRKLNARRIVLANQDIPIAAATLVVQNYTGEVVTLVTSDGGLSRWASVERIPVLRS
jgi:hypothetical protein